MSESIQGTVAKVSRKDGRGAVCFESSDIWYGGFNAAQVGQSEPGDVIKITFKVVDKNGRTFHNLVGNATPADADTAGRWQGQAPTREANGNVMAPASAPAPAMKPVTLDRNRCIIRQNALTNAVNCLAAGIKVGKSVSEDDIIPLARMFEAYTSGDLDINADAPKDVEGSDMDWRAAAQQLSAIK
tara:strand:- start:10638 stop:11195 length:558 start_codon:yes stop_codon:yes gene_type:complete